MRFVLLAFACIVSVSAAACGSAPSTTDTSDSPDTEIRIGAKKSISGLRLGAYQNADAGDGELASLTLEARTRRTPRQHDGVWSGKQKLAGGETAVKGGFQVVRKRIPMPSQASGHLTTYVLKLFDASGALFHEAAYTYVGNTIALYDWKTETEQLLDLEVDATGQRPFAVDCTLTRLLDDNVFEEGLSLDEYPDISIEEVEGKMRVHIGAALYDGDDGERIVVKSRSGSDIDLTIEFSGDVYRVAVKDKKGVIEAGTAGALDKVADFSCR